jgi:translin
MSYAALQSSLSKVAKKLDDVASRRDKLIKESRDVISICSKAIVSTHTGNYDEAKKLAIEARERLETLRKVAGSDLTGYLTTPEQEYVEAITMLSISTKSKKMPVVGELGVSPAAYILGLLDSIGELKRKVFDSIRRGEVANAEAMFQTMERLYILISPFAVYDNIAKGVRRKLDVARMLIEDTRSTVTEEVRRTQFIKSMNDLASKLGAPSLSLSNEKRKNPRRKDENDKRQEMGDALQLAEQNIEPGHSSSQ